LARVSLGGGGPSRRHRLELSRVIRRCQTSRGTLVVTPAWSAGARLLRRLPGVEAVHHSLETVDNEKVACIQLNVSPAADVIAVCHAAEQLMAQVRRDQDDDLLFTIEVASRQPAPDVTG
jgi:hypothetical protein